MSLLKIKLCKKLKGLGYLVRPDEIVFCHHHNRGDTERWFIKNLHCFSSASFCVKSNVVLYERDIEEGWEIEIVAEEKNLNEKS